MRRRIIAGNWKMYKTPRETATFFECFEALAAGESVRCEVVVFPPAINIMTAVEAGKATKIQVGGQNLYWGKEGAFTGEISGEIFASAGAQWVLVGHSERRHVVAHETDADVLKKTQAALAAGLTPIVCVGERLEEHKAGKTNEVLVKQFAGGAAGLTEEQFAKIVVAYEPVWAIGTGHTATPEIAASAHRLIRTEAAMRFGEEAAQGLRILYGGSVKPDNIEGLMNEVELDGALVGGASLDPESFLKIVKAA
jgi:triosephosphate isomerase (TIM)